MAVSIFFPNFYSGMSSKFAIQVNFNRRNGSIRGEGIAELTI